MKRKIFFAAVLSALVPALHAVPASSFRIRDPFILVEGGAYYLYEAQPWSGGPGVWVRTSKDLESWSERSLAMELGEKIPATAVWAPEVHKYDGEYWMFVTLTFKRGTYDVAPDSQGSAGRVSPRGTWVFRSRKPEGPFLPVADGPVPPREWMTLDGTLVVDGGAPYLVFCHEWIQTGDGEMCVARLSPGFASLAEKPKTMFKASKALPGASVVTDGPFFLRSEKSPALHMIWSNMVKDHGYCVLVRTSKSGKLEGPWTADRILYGENGGHGMIFKALDGRLMLALHQPNSGTAERMKLFELEDDGETLKVAGK